MIHAQSNLLTSGKRMIRCIGVVCLMVGGGLLFALNTFPFARFGLERTTATKPKVGSTLPVGPENVPLTFLHKNPVMNHLKHQTPKIK